MIKFSFEIPARWKETSAVSVKYAEGVTSLLTYIAASGRWRASFSTPFADVDYPVFASVLGPEGQHARSSINVYKTAEYIEFGSLVDGDRVSIFIP